MSGSALRKSGNRWEWATNEREWVGVDESDWDQVGVDVSTVQTRSTRRKWECVSVCGLEISHSWWECSENAWEWVKNEQKWVGVEGSACEWVGAQFSITFFIIVCFYHITYTFRKNLHSVIA